MKTLWEKLNQWYANQQNKPVVTPEPEAQKFPVLGLIFGPYNLFIDNTRKFFALSSVFALIITIVFMLFGQNLMCGMSNNSLQSLCSESMVTYLLSRLCSLFLIAMFSVRIYNYCYNNTSFSWRWLLLPQKADFKVMIAYLIYMGLNFVSLLSAYLLYIRVPNPDWRIELTYFAVVSIGFVLPFVLLRFYSIFAYIMSNQKLPSLRHLWQDTAGNGLRLLLSFSLLFCILIFSLNSVIGNFRLVASENTFYITIVGEYIFNLIVLLNVMFFINYCYLQKKFLFGEN
ncbi:MAG: hypothetical protein IJW72_06010 [Alphaproteobacteria bacterium]|nr:hypothetical protein [Alphaproteobacteria bacterium]